MKKKKLTVLSLIAVLLSVSSCDSFSSSVDSPVSDSSQRESSVTDSSSADGSSSSESSIDSSSEESSSTYQLSGEDPYENVDEDEFYANYTPASSLEDALYRSQHYLMSGSIDSQDQEPDLLDYQPTDSSLFIRNSGSSYEDENNTYNVCDANGDYAFTVYKGGAYVTLNEVAAYLYAFGDIPANYDEGKSLKPKQSGWGEYLRLNHSYFSCDTDKYKYEPLLPDTYNDDTGEGNKLYYEIDIGTTGTDCDPSYAAAPYNDGYNITRGAARIVYTRYYTDGTHIEDPNERYVFYTYNHYNDFQEYLNYQGGFGEMFGNITGGGVLSSNTEYNPTPYVQTISEDIYNF